MIKILEYGQVKNEEIFARVEPAVNVEDIVTEIIKDVRKLLMDRMTRKLDEFLKGEKEKNETDESIEKDKKTTISVDCSARPFQKNLIGKSVGDVFSLPNVDLTYRIEKITK